MGSAPSNDLIIEDATVSRSHARLTRAAARDEYQITDLGSTNGTYVNGRRVLGAAPIRKGDELPIGAPRFTLIGAAQHGEVSPPSPPPSAAPTPPSPARSAGGSLGPSGVASPGSAQSTARVSPATNVAPTPRPAVEAEAEVSIRKQRRAAASAPLAPESEAQTMAWLEPLNRDRSMVHLPPVAADPALSEGDAEHARYLVRNYGKIIKANALGIEAHSEDPSKPFYSTTGARAAAASNVDEGWRQYGPPAVSPGQAISAWVGIAFHRLRILNPGLRRAGYGQYCAKRLCVGALDVLSSADPIPMTPAPFANPIQFPPPGAAMRVRSADA